MIWGRFTLSSTQSTHFPEIPTLPLTEISSGWVLSVLPRRAMSVVIRADRAFDDLEVTDR